MRPLSTYFPRALGLGLAAALSNIGWLVADRAFRMGGTLAISVWMARYLGAEQFGLLNYALSLVAIATPLVSLGTSSVIVRDVVHEPSRAPVLVSAAFVLHLAGAAFALCCLGVATALLDPASPLAPTLVSIISLTLILKVTDVVRIWFEAQVQSRYVVWLENGAFAISAGVRAFLIVTSADLIAFAWVTVLESALAAIGLLVTYRRLAGRSLLTRIPAGTVKSLLHDSWPLLFAGMAVMLYMRIDIIMLESMGNQHDVGIYSAATRVSEIFYFLPTVIVASVAPALIRIRRDDPARYIRVARQLYFVLFWIAIGITLPTVLFSDGIITLLYGEEFAAAGRVLAIHLWANIAVFLGVASSQHLVLCGLQKVSLYRTLLGLGCNVALNFVLIPRFGSVGAAVATVISYTIATFSLLLFSRTMQHGLHLLTAPFTPFPATTRRLQQ